MVGLEPSSCTRTGVPAQVSDEALSSGQTRLKLVCGNTVVVTRMNSVTHQS